MLSEGTLREGVLCWQPGMQDWAPLRNLFAPSAFAPQVVLSAVAPTTPVSTYTFARDPLGLTKALKILLWLEIGIAVISILSDFDQLQLATSGAITDEAADANDLRQGAIALIHLLSLIATGIFFLRWIHRANVNCHGFGTPDMKYTPGWSIGWYFVPVANLFVPYHVMKEIWQASTRPRRNRKHVEATALLGWWWTLWILTGVTARFSANLERGVDSPQSLKVATQVNMAATSVEIALCVVAVKLVSEVIEKQVKLIQSGDDVLPDEAAEA